MSSCPSFGPGRQNCEKWCYKRGKPQPEKKRLLRYVSARWWYSVKGDNKLNFNSTQHTLIFVVECKLRQFSLANTSQGGKSFISKVPMIKKKYFLHVIFKSSIVGFKLFFFYSPISHRVHFSREFHKQELEPLILFCLRWLGKSFKESDFPGQNRHQLCPRLCICTCTCTSWARTELP